MSFGRWLLIHSFSLFLVTVLAVGYIYRAELRLEQVYHQLFNIDSKGTITPARTKSPPAVKQVQGSVGPVTKSTVIESGSSVALLSPPPEVIKSPQKPPLAVAAEISPAVSMGLDLQEQLFLARQAYWDKNYNVAIGRYQKLIQEDGNNPDYRGELGNIYYALNDSTNASKLYYQSALIFIQQNRPEQARMLVSPIIAMNRELGERLKSRLR